MNSTSHVSETSSSTRHQHLNVKEEIDADSVEKVIKVEDEWEEVVPVKLEIKTEDEEKPIVCQCEECSSGCRRRMARCTRAMDWSQAIKKEEWDDEDEQSGDMAVKEEGSSRGRVVKEEDDANWAPVRIKREGIEAETGGEAGCRKKAKWTEILVKEEVKEEEDELSMAGPSMLRCGSASADSVIIKFKFEDDEDVACTCEDCGMIKREEDANEVLHQVEEEVAVDGGESEDDETVVEGGSEDKEDWLPSTGSSLGSSSEEEEEEETGDGSTELGQEPIETGPSTAPLEVSPVALADAEQARTAKARKRRRCPQCQKMVTRLNRHLLTHTGQRPHICVQCGKSFNQKSNLNQHLKIHTGEKAFSCQHCGKCSTQKAHLKTHLLIHTGEKAFSCQQCGKCFTRKEHLTVHLKRHSGVKAHQCNQCSSAFVTSTELTIHRRQKHSTE